MKRRQKQRHRKGGRAATSALPGVLPNPGVLARDLFAARIPKGEIYRQHLGKFLDMQRIDYSLRMAEQGQMRPLTDLSREAVLLDGHLSSLLQKRINRLAALDWDVTPAAGDRVDASRAEEYTSFVRSQLDQIPNFRDAITDLAQAIFDGRAASEVQWTPRGNEWHVRSLDWIHARRLSFGPQRDVRVIDSMNDVGGFREDVGYPIQRVPYKFLVYTPRLFSDYPEREGLAPRCMYWSYFQRFATRERMALLELFNRPWRIVRPKDGAISVNDETMRDAYETIKSLGAMNTARLPPGFDVDIHQPFTGAGQVSGEAARDAREVMSKLVLGNTGTTDAVSTGLGSSIGDAHVSEEDLLIWSDARRLAGVIEDQLTDAIIAVNFGFDQLDHAPKFHFRTEPPMNREAELARIKGALEIGMQVSLEEAREKLGIREIKDGEAVLQRVTRPAEFGMGPPVPQFEIVYPAGDAPSPGELAEQPESVINLPSGGGATSPTEPLPSLGPTTTPPALPAGAAELSADEDEPDGIAALCAKMTELQIPACEHGRKNVCTWCGIERVRDVEMVGGEAVWKIEWRPIKKQGVPSVAPVAVPPAP